MDFRFFGQPFVQAFGVPPRCQRNQQRCHCRPNRSSHPSFGAHGRWTMDQLLEEARRQVKAEQASGAIGDYFTFLDSMLNGCHQRAQQQSSAKPAEKPEENGEKHEMKDQEKPKNEASETKGTFETEKAHWLDEKEKVIRYQKQLQLKGQQQLQLKDRQQLPQKDQQQLPQMDLQLQLK